MLFRVTFVETGRTEIAEQVGTTTLTITLLRNVDLAIRYNKHDNPLSKATVID
jgi:hypothetical protein